MARLSGVSNSPQANFWRHERHEALERLAWSRREFRAREWREHRDYDDRRHYRDRDRD